MNEMLKDRLRQALMECATLGSPTTYKALADRLGLVPPQTIHRICEALEILMEEDVAAGRPMLTALCVSKIWSNMHSKGFFLRLIGEKGCKQADWNRGLRQESQGFLRFCER